MLPLINLHGHIISDTMPIHYIWYILMFWWHTWLLVTNYTRRKFYHYTLLYIQWADGYNATRLGRNSCFIVGWALLLHNDRPCPHPTAENGLFLSNKYRRWKQHHHLPAWFYCSWKSSYDDLEESLWYGVVSRGLDGSESCKDRPEETKRNRQSHKVEFALVLK